MFCLDTGILVNYRRQVCYNRFMTATRSTAEERQYQQLRKQDAGADCPFCAIQDGHEQFVTETDHFRVIRNRIPYSLWDSHRVADHLMVVPKQHTDRLLELPKKAMAEYTKILGNYENRGYNIYARSPGSNIKSVIHQHTHLIKLSGHKINFLLMARKPYFRIVR